MERANFAVAHSHPRHVAVVATVEAPTTCSGTSAPLAPRDLVAAQAAVLCLVNRLRVAHREHPLAADSALELAADRHALEMVEGHFFAHTSPDGSTMIARDEEAGYLDPGLAGFSVGENLAWGTAGLSSPASIVGAWEASPDHLANMLDASYKQTGIAVVPGVPTPAAVADEGATYVQEFGALLE